MRPCTRGREPELLERYREALLHADTAKRSTNPKARFEWGEREGHALLAIVREALARMTDGHCSYCDGHPINDTGQETVDHFRPKSKFRELAYTWANLFLACSACNHAKGERWDELLLRPEPDFQFERYFECDFATGELRPAPTASPEEQARAACTIRILRLNRAGTCKSRLRILALLWDGRLASEDNDLPYRYLIPIFRDVT